MRIVEAVIFDLDGVVRHYDPAVARRIEKRHLLPAGSLVGTAFGGALGNSFVCGELDHYEFATLVGDLIGSRPAAFEFLAARAEVDLEAVALVRWLQKLMPVVLLTNGSLRTRTELAAAGLQDVFNHVFNSAETGVPKPQPGAYLNVIETIGIAAESTLFVDDHLPNVAGAREVGLIGHHFQGLIELRAFLAAQGVTVLE